MAPGGGASGPWPARADRAHQSEKLSSGKFIKGAGLKRLIIGTQTFFLASAPPPPTPRNIMASMVAHASNRNDLLHPKECQALQCIAASQCLCRHATTRPRLEGIVCVCGG